MVPPWAVDATESAAYLLEVALGRYSSGLISEWIPSDDFDHDMAASSLSDHPDVWTDGSSVLHGIEASLLAFDSLLKLRSSICRVVWSRRQPQASVGAVLSLLDGPTGCDPAFCVVWFRFRLLRRRWWVRVVLVC